jgi:hypothetical protein
VRVGTAVVFSSLGAFFEIRCTSFLKICYALSSTLPACWCGAEVLFKVFYLLFFRKSCIVVLFFFQLWA